MKSMAPSALMFSFTPIATIRSCYNSRFGVPRQSGLVKSAYGEIIFPETEENRLSLRGLEQFSHIWVIFVFHHQRYRAYKPLVKPPRLGGDKKVGVFATRSPNRLNPIGMSAVELTGVEIRPQEIALTVRGGDFLDGTPVLDIKPYVAYTDSISTATSAWASNQEECMIVQWSPEALEALMQYLESCSSTNANLRNLHCRFDIQQVIQETLAQDPRPAHERSKDGKPGQTWNMHLAGLSINWKVEADIATITHLEPLGP